MNRAIQYRLFLFLLFILVSINQTYAQSFNDEPNAIIDWQALQALFPNAELPKNLPQAPTILPRSSLRIDLSNQPLKQRTTRLEDSPQQVSNNQSSNNQAQLNEPITEPTPSAPPSLPETVAEAIETSSNQASENQESENQKVEVKEETPVEPEPEPIQLTALPPELTTPSPEQIEAEPPKTETPEPEIEINLTPSPVEQAPAVINLPEDPEGLLGRILYAPNATEPSDAQMAILEEIAQNLRQNPEARLILRGFAHDPQAPNADQSITRRLALQRARLIRDYFQELGFSRRQFALSPLSLDQHGKAKPEFANRVDLLLNLE